MAQIEIKEIIIDAEGRLFVRPGLSPSEDFAFIWRDASGVRWNEAVRGLTAAEPARWEYFDLYRQILAAARNEYGKCLIVTARTRWSGVAAELQERIRAWPAIQAIEVDPRC